MFLNKVIREQYLFSVTRFYYKSKNKAGGNFDSLIYLTDVSVSTVFLNLSQY